MIEEQAQPASVEQIAVQSISQIFKTVLPNECKQIILDVFEKADTSFNENGVQDNLLKTQRTSWLVHEEFSEIHPVLDMAFATLNNAFQQLSMGVNFAYSIQLFYSWIS